MKTDELQKSSNSRISTIPKKNMSFEFENILLRPTYKPLTRNDFDMNVQDKWLEIKCINVPRRRSYHSSFIHKDTLYIFGGVDLKEGRISEMSSISLKFIDNIQWINSEVYGDIPEPLSDQAGTLVEDSYYMFGGQNTHEEVTNNLYVFNLNNSTWKMNTFCHNSIIPLSSHTCCYYQEANNLVIFGGYSKGLYSNKIFFYDVEQSIWTKYKDEVNHDIPEGRIKHTANVINNYMYIYGGQTIDGIFLSDMWKFNLTEMKWEQISFNNSSPDDIPTGKSGHTSIYNNTDNSLYIFGGKIGHAQERNDMWKFDLQTEKFHLVQDTLLEVDSDSKPSEISRNKRSNIIF